MNKLYDNGTMLLGNVNDIILDIERNIKSLNENLYGEMIDEYQELLNDIVTARDKDHAKYVMVNYDNPMGYTFEYWTDEEEDLSYDFNYEVKDYVENEIQYIKEQMCNGYDMEDYAKDLVYLNGLTDKDIKHIAEKVFYDEQLNETTNDMIHYYLYHNDKYIKGGDLSGNTPV